ncbi:MAG: hypothetical protein JXQ83_13340 [Candidatus Glassbacteria bacterium]|nr:hypothetical protein [Candidatus Glassbacteria bacterium]
MKTKRLFFQALLLLLAAVWIPARPVAAQEEAAAPDRWEESIRQFEARDSVSFPEPGVIVFIGSSSIRGWHSLAEDFSPLKVINRGFGGSQTSDALYYADRIVIPYKPGRIVLYEGDNDIAAGKTPETVAADFRKFVAKIHRALPGTPVYFISVKPSLSRWSLWEKMKEANRLVAGFCENNQAVEYIDVATPMLGQDSMPRQELF